MRIKEFILSLIFMALAIITGFLMYVLFQSTPLEPQSTQEALLYTGITFLGFVCLAFLVLFVVFLILAFTKDKNRW